MSDKIAKPIGTLSYNIFQGGRLISSETGLNLVLKGYQLALSRLIAGGDPAQWGITSIGFGTSAVAPNFNQASLTSSFVKDVDLIGMPDAKTTVFSFSLGTTEANGMNISEFGLLTGNGTLFSRKTRTAPIIKTSDIAIEGSWEISFKQ